MNNFLRYVCGVQTAKPADQANAPEETVKKHRSCRVIPMSHLARLGVDNPLPMSGPAYDLRRPRRLAA